MSISNNFIVAVGPQYDEYLGVDHEGHVYLVPESDASLFHLDHGRIRHADDDKNDISYVAIISDALVAYEAADEFVLRGNKIIRSVDEFDNDWLFVPLDKGHKRDACKKKAKKWRRYNPWSSHVTFSPNIGCNQNNTLSSV